MWRGEYQENCIQTARLNAQAGQAQCNLDMLTGAGAYADLANQIVLDPAVYLLRLPKLGKPYQTRPRGINCQKFCTQMQQDLEKAGLIIAPEKVQMQAPYSYLGYQSAMDGIKPKKN